LISKNMIVMKRKYIIYFVLSALIIGCTDKFEDFNTDQKNPVTAGGNTLFSNGQKELADQVNQTNVNQNIFKLWAQYWTETTYTDEANYDLVTRNISDNIFRYYYREGALQDLNEAAKSIAMETDPATESTRANRQYIISILKSYAYQQLVDIFGMVPYTEALNVENVYPVYDLGQDIYYSILDTLDAAISGLDDSQESFGAADLFYGGDVAAWIKFANAMKIKIGITLADFDATTAQRVIEEAVAGAFGSSADDCLMPYQSASPNQNPLYEEIIATGRKDFVLANTFVDMLNNLQDPRIFFFLEPEYMQSFVFIDDADENPKDTTVTEEDGGGVGRYLIFTTRDGESDSMVYKTTPFTLRPATDTLDATVRHYAGGRYGYSSPWSRYAHIHPTILTPDFNGFMLTYTEMLFYLAEAAERGFNVPQSAEFYYNAGIKSSIEEWITDPTIDVDSVADAYLAQPSVAYATAEGDWKQKIATQEWIAAYTRGLEGYTTWRRLDYPIFNIPQLTSAYEDIPKRFTFPIQEQTLNPANYEAAADAVGGDEMTTRIFWDME
jgi:hypothetical protein